MRAIDVDGVKWRYKVGKTHVVAIRVDGKSKWWISFARLTGLSWNEVERGIRKRWLSITPQLIYNWLSGKDLRC